MRNLSMKSNFTKPQATNSFRKTDRHYPDPKPLANSTTSAMSQQKPSPKLVQNYRIKTQPILTHQQSTYSYHFTAQNPFPITDRNSQIQHLDSTCIWYHNLQKSPNKNKLYIKFDKMQYVISNWTQDLFPKVIYLCVDGILGFLDIYGHPTDRIAALQLAQITAQYDVSTLRTYQLRYQNRKQRKWLIPSELTHIKLSIKIQDQQQHVQLPLPNPITISIQIGQQKSKN